jgi:hypothetical protein
MPVDFQWLMQHNVPDNNTLYKHFPTFGYNLETHWKYHVQTNGGQADPEENSNIQLQKRKENIGRPQLRWRDQRTLQKEGTDHVWPNPV